MGQTEEIKMMPRSGRAHGYGAHYTPITRGHKPTASQESNTLSTMSEVSCITTVSEDSEPVEGARDPVERLADFREEEERSGLGARSGSEETVDTVVTVRAARLTAGQEGDRMRSRNSDYSSYGQPSPGTGERGPAAALDRPDGSFRSARLLPSDDSDGDDEDPSGSVPAGAVKVELPPAAEGGARTERIPGEPLKTLLAGLFLGTGFLATTTSLAFTHERVPLVDPLPDLILDQFHPQKWGLDVSEMLLMANTFTAVAVILLHSHRTIILRRIWLMLGLLYYYRALTMMITVLPKSDKDYECHPKQNETTPMMYVERVLTIISGGGLSINGKHVFCGDYIFSGHTMTLTLGYLAIKQYSPKRFQLLHWASFLAALLGVIFLLLARGHYTIDVLLAYYVSSRLWWIYHTLAHNQNLKTKGPHNLLSNLCWWHIFRFFEKKTCGPLPNRYSLPFPRRAKRWLRQQVCGGRDLGPRLQSVSCQDVAN